MQELWHRVCVWVDGLHDDPRQYPSQPEPRDYGQWSDELRAAVVPGTRVRVIYAVDDERKQFRILEVSADPPVLRGD